MGVERVDYYYEAEYAQALENEQREMEQQEQEADQIDMMDENELRIELRGALVKIEAQRRGEFICVKCGLRKCNREDKDDLPF